MPLAVGSSVGPYEILAPLGAGGMGEVYRARDTRLGRDVAIKVLPASVATDPERRARFEREARAVAALSHPNILAIFEFAVADGTAYAATELLEGQTLREHLNAPLPVRKSIDVATQIARGLAAAHDKGIVHRDLKPENVFLVDDGQVKILDFGLAKAVADGGQEAETVAGTNPGIVLGTVGYMAPEQIRGQAVDGRADLFALGAVLYEMLAGRRAFQRDTAAETMTAILKEDPPELSMSRGDLPPALDAVVRHCLERNPTERFQSARDLIFNLHAVSPTTASGSASKMTAAVHSRARIAWRETVAWSLAALAVVAAATIVVWQRMAPGADPPASDGAGDRVTRLSVLPPPGFLMNPDSTNVAISPNGRMVAFIVGTGVSTENQLWVRPLDASTARRIESGDGVAQPFWSPDSERIGFFANRKLKTVPAAGGAADIVCDAPFGRGATWNASNVIVFAPDSTGPLSRVSATGGPATPLTALDAARQETGHRFPVFLPDGEHFLFAALPGTDGVYQIFASTLRDPLTRTAIGPMESAPVYQSGPGPSTLREPQGRPEQSRGATGSGQGWLLFTRQGVMAARPFDARTLQFTGDAVSLGDEPAVAPGSAAYEAGRRVSVSLTGGYAYYLEPSGNTNVQWMDQAGKTTGTVSVPPGRYSGVAIAPNQTKAVLVRSDTPTSWSLWLADLTRASAVPLLTGVSKNPAPIWSPDSTRIVFASERGSDHGLFEKSVAGASSERLIFRVDNSSVVPQDWSRDLAWIVVGRVDPGTKWNVFRVPVSGSGAPVALVNGPAIEVPSSLSPDNRWLSYLSDEAGHLDLYVQSFPGGGPGTQVVAAGGIQRSWWTPDGRHLLYLKRDQSLWRVGVDLRAAPPRIDPPVQLGTFPPALVALDLAPDGRQFLALVPERAGLGAVTIVQNWHAALPSRNR